MLTVTGIDMTGFNKGIANLIGRARLSAPVVIKKEMGELIKTLARISPPQNVEKSKASIAKGVAYKFDIARRRESLDSRTNPGGIRWTHWSKQFLYGTANELDWRNVSDVNKVRRAYYTITATGRQIVPFNFARKIQRVALSRALLLKDGMVQKVIARIQKNIGRLKAGWTVSVTRGIIPLSAGNRIPQWVVKHSMNARGRYQNGLAIKDRPAFEISNYSEGISSKAAKRFAADAVAIRAKAMASNFKMMMGGRKNLADYAKGL